MIVETKPKAIQY